ncbi:hypothetical protein MAR_005502 [Mya arenaria]|uniref:Uncharacterized protein n=1 Tax=Mya arenaria TaxID=6604 RepID=A0ABY7EZP0_MYAAR|nr:hypothetical protein MAR_005502 [Mya arenaria]
MFRIDEVPLYKSNSLQLLPVLCSTGDFEPFIVSVFYGRSKLNSVNIYVTNHTAYCERCIVKVEWNGRVVYNIPEEDKKLHELHTDERFAETLYPEHQVTRSPLMNANTLCIKSSPLNYMQLVCLGPKECKFSQQQLSRVFEKLNYLNGKIPTEFACQPWLDMNRWKASVFRQFLLYKGPLVLRPVVSKEVYDHFFYLWLRQSQPSYHLMMT